MDIPTTSLPKYQCHKIVTAGKIRQIDLEPNGNGGAILKFESNPDTKYEDIMVEQAYLDKHNPQIGGYYVVYEDGYESFSPTDAFESGYSLIIS